MENVSSFFIPLLMWALGYNFADSLLILYLSIIATTIADINRNLEVSLALEIEVWMVDQLVELIRCLRKTYNTTSLNGLVIWHDIL